VRYEPLGFELLPRRFTLTQLQHLYETILEAPLDKRNFRKKILGMGLLIETDEIEQDVAHRAARLFSFDVVSITASYLKATLLRLLKARRGERPQAGDAGLSTPTGFHLFTFVTGCSTDVAVDIHEFFVGRNLPLVHLDHWEKNRLIDGRLMGTLDPVLFRTLEGVIRLKECTASRLVEISSETITVNGWSNRLADLYQFSLVTRRRDSKFWIYSSVIERITLWA